MPLADLFAGCQVQGIVHTLSSRVISESGLRCVPRLFLGLALALGSRVPAVGRVARLLISAAILEVGCARQVLPGRCRCDGKEALFFLAGAGQEPNGLVWDVAEPRPPRGHGGHSMYVDRASGYWVAAALMEDACRSPDRRCRVSKPDG